MKQNMLVYISQMSTSYLVIAFYFIVCPLTINLHENKMAREIATVYQLFIIGFEAFSLDTPWHDLLQKSQRKKSIFTSTGLLNFNFKML